MKGVKKGIHFVVDGILRIALILAAVVMIASFFGYRTYIIQSGSMEPVLETGSVVVVNEFATYDDVEVGDIVAFKTATGAKVTHRVIDITPNGFETKGDNNDLSDGVTTTKSNFCGITYEFCIPGAGYVLESANQGNGKMAIIMIVTALVLLDIMLDDDGETEDKKKKKSLPVKEVSVVDAVDDTENQAPAETQEQETPNDEA